MSESEVYNALGCNHRSRKLYSYHSVMETYLKGCKLTGLLPDSSLKHACPDFVVPRGLPGYDRGLPTDTKYGSCGF